MECGKDHASHSDNHNRNLSISERTNPSTINATNSSEVSVNCLNNIKREPTESSVVINVTITNADNAKMAPTIEEKNVSDKLPTPETKEKKQKPRKEKPKDVVTFRTHLTSLAHVSVLVFVYMVIKLALKGEFVFFTWHPILMGVGWMLMTQGFYAINKYNTYWRFKTKGGFRVQIHVILLAVGYALSLAGFAIVYINKNYDNKPHFATWHGLFGLIGIICTVPPVLNGILLWYKKELAQYIHSAKLLKFGHVLSGCLAFSFGALALVLGVYSRWFAKKSEKSELVFYGALICVSYPLLWAVYGPAVKLINVVKDYFSEEKED